jgi:hypothetical protein
VITRSAATSRTIVENGLATLEGEVGAWPEATAAIENAREGGALRVRSRLDIQTLPRL